MRFFLPKGHIDGTLVSNIGEFEDENGDTYSQYELIKGYNSGSIVAYNQKIYECVARPVIFPLAHYLWRSMIIGSEYTTSLHGQNDIYPDGNNEILIDIVDGETVVYVESNGFYYLAKATKQIDFMSEDIEDPANFNKIDITNPPYRYEYNSPASTTGSTLFWKYLSVSNQQRVFDRAIGSQSQKIDEVTYTFDVNAVSGLVCLNVEAQSIYIKVTDKIAGDILYEETADMIDTSHLDNYEKVCTVDWKSLATKAFLFPARYSQQVELIISNPSLDAKIGAIKFGLVESLGKTLDGVQVRNKSYNESGVRDNGEYLWNPDDKDTNKVFLIDYQLKLDTNTFDNSADKLKCITDKEVVLIGEDTDEIGYRTLVNYGAITSTDATLMSGNSKSNASIGVENFI